MNHRELIIAGHWVGGPCDQSIGKEVCRAPWSGAVIGTVAEGGESELITALEAAHEAGEIWARSQQAERQDVLQRIATAIRENAEVLSEMSALEIAKPINLARAEVERCARSFDIAAHELRTWGREELNLHGDPRATKFQVSSTPWPRGVVFAITPYNWPYNLAAHKIAPAIAAGCGIVWKPSPLSAFSSFSLARIIHECVPVKGLFNAWNGATNTVSKLLAHPRVKVISFTGSQAAGWQIKAANPAKHVILELGANATSIIDPHYPIGVAVSRLIPSAYGYAGQVCISAQNVFVHESKLAQFCEEWMAQMAEISPVDPLDTEGLMSAMIHEAAVEKVQAIATDSHEKGALIYGLSRDRNRLTPGLIVGAGTHARIRNEEAFGPVCAVNTYSDECPRIAFEGIHASIFTDDDGWFRAASERLDVSGLVRNDAPSVRFDAMPYGGNGLSGVGREGIRYAMNEFSQPRVLIERIED